jgi:hypothetical protein
MYVAPVEAAASSVVADGGPGIGVRGGFLDLAERDSGIQRSPYERMPEIAGQDPHVLHEHRPIPAVLAVRPDGRPQVMGRMSPGLVPPRRAGHILPWRIDSPSPEEILNRIGYGAMQLAGPRVFRPTPDRAAAIELCSSRPVGRANHLDPVTPPHLPGGDSGGGGRPTGNFQKRIDMGETA